MKWIVTQPDGKEVEQTGGSAKDAATNAARAEWGDPERAGIKLEYKVRRKNPPDSKTEVCKIISRCYWGDNSYE